MSGDELTSALNAYLSQFTHHSDDEKREIAETLTGLVRNSLPHGNMATMNITPMDRHKIRFIEKYVQSLGRTHLGTDHIDGASIIRFGPDPQAVATPATPSVTPRPASNASPQRRRQRQDPIADAIGGLGQAVAASGSNSQWQQNVTQTSGQLTNNVADAVAERVAAPLTNAIRRSVSSSRSAQATPPQSTPAVLTSGNVMSGATFQPFQPTGEVPDLNNPPRFSNVNVPQLSDEENERRLNNFVNLTDQNETPALTTPARVTPQTQTGGAGIPPGPPRGTASQSRSAPTPNWNPSTATLAQRAAANAEHARRIVADIAGTGGGAGAGIPPIPPGGNGPPNPPDDPEDDDNILNRLLEFFQRMFGIRPDTDNRSFLDTLANNLTSILGGVPAQAGADGQRPSAITTLMDTFADYFNVPRETEDATRQAQETLRRSIDRLTDATNSAANGGTPAQPQGRFARFRSFFRRGRGRRGGIATATRVARFMRPVLNRLGNMVPAPLRQAAGQIGVNTVTQIVGRFGVPPATAARFGTALGPAAIGIGVLAYGLPLLGTGIKMTINGLNKLSDQALKTTFALASYGGLLAHANAQLEVNREMRKFDMANRMGGFGAERLGQLNRLENAMQPWKIMGNNAGNMWGTLIDSALSTLLEHINSLIAVGMDLHAAILDWVPGDQGEAQMRAAADMLRNPAAAMPNPWQAQDALFGQNGVDAIDFARRQRGPRPPNNGGN